MKYAIVCLSLFIFLYIFFRVFFLKRSKDHQLFGIILVLIYCIFAFLKEGGPDFLEYEKMYESMQELAKENNFNMGEFINIGKDFNFSIWIYINSILGVGFGWMIFISAFLSLNLKRLAWRSLGLDASIALSVWFFTYYFILDLTQIRAAISVAFCFIALGQAVKGYRLNYLFFMLLAIGFHAQAGIFLVCSVSLMLRLDFNIKLKFIIIISLIFSLMTSVLFKYYAEIDTRPGILDINSDFPLNGIVASLMNFGFLCFLLSAALKSVDSDEFVKISKLSFVFVVVGFFFLILNLYSSSALAWRSYEMFNCFGVILVTVILTQSSKFNYKLMAISYMLFNFILNMRTSLI